MARIGTRVRQGVLTNGRQDQAVPVDSDAWARWLEQPDNTAFRFEQGATPFTARKEQQRGRWYWYAYRRRNGRLHKAYLGRSGDLTLARLEEVGARLNAGGDHEPAASQLALGRRHNLPAELSSFLGRERELAELGSILGTRRLLTLTGTGGIGKTRLALKAAAGLSADSVWLVELATLTDPTLVPQAVAEAVEVREEAGRPLLATLVTALGFGRVLLVLDNCEHLLDACARLTEHLLRACPNLRVLATSREPLNVPGEVSWPVPGLGLPEGAGEWSVEELARFEAVRLFVERAQAACPSFALSRQNAPAVYELCRGLDAIPLALELAAAQLRFLTPDEILDRLDDRFRLLGSTSRTMPRRQQTLRATVDWSYDLLAEPEQRLFERLSVFAGGFSLDAAGAVCAGEGLDAFRVLELLSRLVDRSLVLAEAPDGTATTRYRLLDTLRAYGQERLLERGESERIRERHARWMVDRARRAEQAFRSPEPGWWLWWVEREHEHDNVRAALGWALERRETELAVSLAGSLALSWLLHGQWSEGLDWARRVLALPEKTPSRERGVLLAHAIELSIFQGDIASNRPSGDLSTVADWMREYLALGESLGDDELLLAGHGLAYLLDECGVRLEGVPEVDLEAMLEETRRIGHTWGECRGLEALARRAFRAGDLVTAGARLNEAVELARATGDIWSMAVGLNELGDVERVRGAYRRAEQLYEGSMEAFTRLRLGVQPSLVHNLGYVALALGDATEAQSRFTRALVEYRRLGGARGIAECLLGLGAVAAAEGRAADAARLSGAGEAAIEDLGIELWPANRIDGERWQARARRSLGRSDYDRVRVAGRRLTLEQAAILALRGGNGEVEACPARHETRDLTPREREVAQLAAQGLTNRQIGEALVIAEKTAANHMQRVLDKLDLHSRTQLAARASQLGLIPSQSTMA